jgi:hypothetical protein
MVRLKTLEARAKKLDGRLAKDDNFGGGSFEFDTQETMRAFANMVRKVNRGRDFTVLSQELRLGKFLVHVARDEF